jgi:AcrR family transcriptional regulator
MASSFCLTRGVFNTIAYNQIVARAYDSTRRRQQAQVTRQGVLACARRLFLERGYAHTTMAAIAEAGGVSKEMLYATWGSKGGIVGALLRESLRGDEDAAPLEQGEKIAAIRAAGSARAALELYGELLAEVQPQLAPLLRLLRDGAAGDEELARMLERNSSDRLAGMRRFAEHLAERGALAPGLGVERAGDVLWTLNSSELFDMIVEERGWSPEQYGSWVAALLAGALLADARGPDGS